MIETVSKNKCDFKIDDAYNHQFLNIEKEITV